jgi:hypothetical protein
MDTNGAGANRIRLEGRIVTALAALAFLALGCGERNKQSAANTGTPAAAVEETNQAVAASSGSTQLETSGESVAITAADSLPPDVTASASDTLAIPGGVVEITAQGSPDVTTVTLADGVGQKYPLAYDSAANVWRVFYRVPLRTTAERVGLSVTARNGLNRWSRVWVFLTVPREEPGARTEPTSGS